MSQGLVLPSNLPAVVAQAQAAQQRAFIELYGHALAGAVAADLGRFFTAELLKRNAAGEDLTAPMQVNVDPAFACQAAMAYAQQGLRTLAGAK